MAVRHKLTAASYLVLMKDTQVLLYRRYNTGYEDGNYSVVAGHLDPNETLTECIIRETEEEIGITIAPKDLKMTHMMHRHSGLTEEYERLDAFFVCTQWTGEIVNKEPHKCDDLQWFPIDQLPNNTIPYIKQAIQCVQNNIFYSEHGWNSTIQATNPRT